MLDLPVIFSDFIDDVLGATSEYGLTDLHALEQDGAAASFIRLRLNLYRALIEDGWTPPAQIAAELERDRQLVTEPDEHDIEAVHSQAEDFASLRARASRVRSDAHDMQSHAHDSRRASVDLRVELEQMRQAMASRAIIEQAKGIAMERFGLPADVAWSWLVRTSQQRNVKLREIAHEIVESATHAAQSASSASAAPSA